MRKELALLGFLLLLLASVAVAAASPDGVPSKVQVW
jgi:hypothetical protein